MRFSPNVGDTSSIQETNENIVNNNVSSPHGISIENASYIENNIEVENTLDKIDSGTEYTPKLFTEEDNNLEDENLQNEKKDEIKEIIKNKYNNEIMTLTNDKKNNFSPPTSIVLVFANFDTFAHPYTI